MRRQHLMVQPQARVMGWATEPPAARSSSAATTYGMASGMSAGSALLLASIPPM